MQEQGQVGVLAGIRQRIDRGSTAQVLDRAQEALAEGDLVIGEPGRRESVFCEELRSEPDLAKVRALQITVPAGLLAAESLRRHLAGGDVVGQPG